MDVQFTAQPAFADLQRTLVDTEDRIALARAYLTDLTQHWNDRVHSMPQVLVARLCGFAPLSLG